MKKIVTAFALVFAFSSVYAQNAAPVNPAASAAVKELLLSMKYRDLVTQSFAELEKNMPAMMLAGVTAAINGNAKLSDAEKLAAIEEAKKQIPTLATEFGAVLRDEKLMDELFAEMTPLYARRFSVAEIRQIAAFYKTPVGLKMLKLTPEIMNESVQISQKIVMPRIAALMEKLAQGKQ
ncbi:MAG: DUF2059 domain-containing protein [Pseudomonadota bacterium]